MAAGTGQPQRQESGRSILRIEHAVRDFDEWKRVFDDRGGLLRQQFGDLWGQREAEGLIVGPQGRIVVAVENRGEG